MATTGVATAQAPVAPANDAYLQSLSINQPGTVLDYKNTLKAVTDTTLATTQTDIFSPPSSGGGAEVNTCHNVTFGKTVWYDFHPDVDGTMSIRTNGFNNVIALYTYGKSLKPNIGSMKCVNQSGDIPSEQLVSNVKKGKDYTVQIGGVDDAGGTLVTLFDFTRKPPAKLAADATLTAAATANGIQLKGLTVKTTAKATVAVKCDGHCHTTSHSGKSKEKFPNLNGVSMPAGSQLQIRVTAPNSIGVFIAYNIHPGRFTKITRCLKPGSKTPQTKCQ